MKKTKLKKLRSIVFKLKYLEHIFLSEYMKRIQMTCSLQALMFITPPVCSYFVEGFQHTIFRPTIDFDTPISKFIRIVNIKENVNCELMKIVDNLKCKRRGKYILNEIKNKNMALEIANETDLRDRTSYYGLEFPLQSLKVDKNGTSRMCQSRIAKSHKEIRKLARTLRKMTI